MRPETCVTVAAFEAPAICPSYRKMRSLPKVIAKVFGAIAIVVVSFLAADFLLEHYWGGPCYTGRRTEIKPPFQKRQGFAFWKDKMPFAGSTPTEISRSVLRLCENDKPLGPANSFHDSIYTQGKGRFSHWGTELFFATSDNSDPNTNGRSYVVVDPR